MGKGLRCWRPKPRPDCPVQSPKIYIILRVNWCQSDLAVGPRLPAQFPELFFSINLYLVNIMRGNLFHNFVFNNVPAEVQNGHFLLGCVLWSKISFSTTQVIREISEKFATYIFWRSPAWARCQILGAFWKKTPTRQRSACVLLGGHAAAGGPMLAMSLGGQVSGSVDKQGDHFYFCWEALSFVKINKISFLWLYAALY